MGLLLATWALPALLALAPEGIPLPEEVRIDGAVLAFTLGVSVLTGLLFGRAARVAGLAAGSAGLAPGGARRAAPPGPRGTARGGCWW